MSFTPFNLGSHAVTPGGAPLFLPDIGTFFNQDEGLALEMVDRLAEAGVRVIKGEVLHDPDICLDDGTAVRYPDRQGGMREEPYRRLIERKVVPLPTYERIFGHARDRGMGIVLSIYDLTGLRFALDLDVDGLKVATSNIVHQPLITVMAATGRPLLIDTGDSSLEEIDRAVSWARDGGAERLLVEHSPYPPPAGPERHDLRFMVSLGRSLGLPFGLSDHHHGEEMLYAATALGASLLEKGVCPDGLDGEQDVAHALPIGQVARVEQACATIHTALGREYRPLDRNRPRKLSRMGLVAARDLAPGEPLSLETVRFAFPARGIRVEQWEEAAGRCLVRGVAAGQPVGWHDLSA